MLTAGFPLEFKPSAWRLSLQCANLSCLTVASTRGGACGLIRCDARQSYDSPSGGARLSFLQEVILAANPVIRFLTSHHARALGCSRATMRSDSCGVSALELGPMVLGIASNARTGEVTRLQRRHTQHESYLWPCTHRPSHSRLKRR